MNTSMCANFVSRSNPLNHRCFWGMLVSPDGRYVVGAFWERDWVEGFPIMRKSGCYRPAKKSDILYLTEAGADPSLIEKMRLYVAETNQATNLLGDDVRTAIHEQEKLMAKQFDDLQCMYSMIGLDQKSFSDK